MMTFWSHLDNSRTAFQNRDWETINPKISGLKCGRSPGIASRCHYNGLFTELNWTEIVLGIRTLFAMHRSAWNLACLNKNWRKKNFSTRYTLYSTICWKHCSWTPVQFSLYGAIKPLKRFETEKAVLPSRGFASAVFSCRLELYLKLWTSERHVDRRDVLST